ncbi:MAG TPA: Type 1 glutamine amidotransferase-like domain-containing protein, partial [Clostridia bacterium]|nr:Type 1 glutamine amidotransferase-like domain-containing protein [Clostridia bacterium]
GRHAWKNVLLTDSGWYRNFEGGLCEKILRTFQQMLEKPAGEATVLFVPTAATTDEARPAAGKCFAELLSAGISPNNIHPYDIDGSMTLERAMAYDVVYCTGGDTGHLLKRMKETGFDKIVKRMVYGNKVYVGASAGSKIATPNIGDPFDKGSAGLALVNAYLSFHCPPGTSPREDLPLPHIPLSGGQALVVRWDGYSVIEG